MKDCVLWWLFVGLIAAYVVLVFMVCTSPLHGQVPQEPRGVYCGH